MDGILNIYKPKGMTSFDVVSKIKKILKTSKVGHAGTLDPLATGVLPVCVGKATKIIEYMMTNDKTYKVILQLGISTDTYDLEGKVIECGNFENISEEEILQCIKGFIGEQGQIPPMYSAIKVNGEKLYNLARKGITVHREPRNINIYNIYDINIHKPYVEFTVNCSKGTYIRSLCYDIGVKLQCGATMAELERVSNGYFKKENSIDINNIDGDNVADLIIPIEEALDIYEKIEVEDQLAKLLINGVCVGDTRILPKVVHDKIYVVYSKQEALIGLAMRNSKGFKIIKLLM